MPPGLARANLLDHVDQATWQDTSFWHGVITQTVCSEHVYILPRLFRLARFSASHDRGLNRALVSIRFAIAILLLCGITCGDAMNLKATTYVGILTHDTVFQESATWLRAWFLCTICCQ